MTTRQRFLLRIAMGIVPVALVALAASADDAAPAKASVTGTIRDAKGQPIAGVVVSVEGGGSAKTDAAGAWTIASVAPGDAVVTAQVPGRFRVQTMLHVAAGEARHWDATIGKPGVISGHLIDEYDHPLTATSAKRWVDGWQIQTIPEPQWMYPPLIEIGGDLPGKDGAFELHVTPGILVRLRVLQVKSFSRALLTEPMTAGLCDVTLRLLPANMPHARVHCRVEAPDGKALTATDNVSIHLGQSERCWSKTSFEVEKREWISSPVVPGEYTIVVVRPPCSGFAFPAFQVPDAADVDLGTLRLPPTGRVRFAAIRSGPGSEGDAQVLIRRFLSRDAPEPGWPGAWGAGAGPVLHGDAAADADLFPGRYVSVAFCSRPRTETPFVEQVETPFEVRSGETTSVTIPLRAAPSRTIHLHYAAARPLVVMVTASDADGVVEGRAYATGEKDVTMVLVPGRHAIAVVTNDRRRLTGTLDVPAENPPDVFDVPLR